MPDMRPNRSAGFRSIAPALELCAWLTVFLMPVVRLINGPPVTDDQRILQAATFGLPLISALALRLYNWRMRRW